jgi:hypothetical protein
MQVEEEAVAEALLEEILQEELAEEELVVDQVLQQAELLIQVVEVEEVLMVQLKMEVPEDRESLF